MANGKRITGELISRLTAAAGDQLVFAGNLKMSEEYRRHMAGVLIRQAIEQAQEDRA